MVAARRNREPRYSLAAQAQTHLNLRLDKSAQKSDWSRRPLDAKQIYYAASDAFAALLLYEHQTARGLNGTFQLKEIIPRTAARQTKLPLTDAFETTPLLKYIELDSAAEEFAVSDAQPGSVADRLTLNQSTIALLGVIAELSGRYHPDGLAVSVGAERVGIAGWIADHILEKDTYLDEETAKLGIVELIERKLVVISEARRLVATAEGARLWEQMQQSKGF